MQLRRHRFIAVLGCLTVLHLFPAHAAENAVEQQWCPVTTDERIDLQFFADYEGERVYFCCARCRGRFERNPEQYAANLAQYVPAFAAAHASHADEHPVPHAHNPAHEEPDAGHDHHDHDHAVDIPLLTWLGRHHPFVVHFPIAFLLAAAGVELFRRGRDNAFLRDATRFCVRIGGGSAIIAGALGWLFGGFRLVDETSLMTWHRWIGTAVVVSVIPLIYLAERYFRAGGRGAHRGFHGALAISAGLTAWAGFLGGSLIYGLDHLLW